jgi:GR25 family glycosyltransferase involved in LPS biosynthesis
LSLGRIVVSERASDQPEHTLLEKYVEFLDVDDVEGMVDRVRSLLANRIDLQNVATSRWTELSSQLSQFKFHFMRFLLAIDVIDFDTFWEVSGKYNRLANDRVCLNLPESVERRQSFLSDNEFGFRLFPGLRHSKSWIGCAYSYKYLGRLAKRDGLQQLIVCEDDVEFYPDFEKRFDSIQRELSGKRFKWDVYSGLMADIHEDAEVSAVTKVGSETFVEIDRLISMVFNIYGPRAQTALSLWDPGNRDVQGNTIDRYLEKSTGIDVVVSYPFLVGHKEDLKSSIWGFGNSQYSQMIAASAERLKDLIKKCKNVKRVGLE